MTINKLDIKYFRNIEQAKIQLVHGLNLLHGDNAAGKTSILEAIAVLSSLKSFRCSNLNELVNHGQPGFQLVAQLADQQDRETVLGVQRESGTTSIRANGEKLARSSELSERLPVQIIHPDSHLLVAGGPKQRRRFLDWGVFHVEHEFISAWRRFDKALKQRNAALRSNKPWDLINAWDGILSEAANTIHQCRSRYLEDLVKTVPEFSQNITGAETVQIDYRPGWDIEQPLDKSLLKSRDRDRSRGFTGVGPHRAELLFRVNGKQADNYVSRGQQKMLVVALLLAQVKLFVERKRQSCVVLLDDLVAELDKAHLQRILTSLEQLNAQSFITSVQTIEIPHGIESKVFHVEHGQVQEVV